MMNAREANARNSLVGSRIGKFDVIEQSAARRVASLVNRWVSRRTLPNERDIAISALVLSAARKQPRGVFTFTDSTKYADGRRDLRLSFPEHFREAVQRLQRGVVLTALDEARMTRFRRDHVGFVFQFYNLVPSLTARENVALITEISHDPMTPGAALELAGLPAARHDHFPAQLSGGEQQRVALARAFVTRPAVLFADEPTGNLDTVTGARVTQLLFEMNSSAHTTVVLVTHDRELASRCGRMLVMEGGRLV